MANKRGPKLFGLPPVEVEEYRVRWEHGDFSAKVESSMPDGDGWGWTAWLAGVRVSRDAWSLRDRDEAIKDLRQALKRMVLLFKEFAG